MYGPARAPVSCENGLVTRGWCMYLVGVAALPACAFHVEGAAEEQPAVDLAAAPADLSGRSFDLATPVPDLADAPDLTPIAGLLSAVKDDTPATNDLTGEGSLDWAHFGLSVPTDVNRKLGANLILEAVTGAQMQYSFVPSFGWSDGAPTQAVPATRNGVYVKAVGTAYQITFPVGTTQRVAKIYVESYYTTGSLVAHLSDGSAPDFHDTVVATALITPRYTFTCSASSPGQTLTVTWTLTSGAGSIGLLAASLH